MGVTVPAGLAIAGGVSAALYSVYSLFWWYEGEQCEKPKYTVQQVVLHSSHKLRLRNFHEIEVREYSPYLIAETTIKGKPMRKAMGTGFMNVARFIFGANTKADSEHENEKVAMTSPVRMEMKESEKIAMTSPVRMQVQDGPAAGTPAEGEAGERIAYAAPMQMEIEGTSKEAAHFGNDPDAAQMYKISFVMPAKYTKETLPVPKDSTLEIKEVPQHSVIVHTHFGGNPPKEHVLKIAAELREHAEKAGLETDGDVMLYQYHPPFAPSFLRRVEVLYNLK